LKSLHLAAVAGLLLLPLGACQSTSIGQAAFGEDAASLADRPDVDFYASDRPLVIGVAQFQSGNYGKAEQAFRKATQLTPTDGAAWLGLAAAYDRLRRFDAADVAYRQAAKYVGSRPEYYNNVGYSYMLRGNLREARRFFLKAYELDPNNPVTANNLALLRSSIDGVQRG
jgi:Flp pilus assembly protein TadD